MMEWLWVAARPIPIAILAMTQRTASWKLSAEAFMYIPLILLGLFGQGLPF
jgi:hypothetical protein